MMKKYSLEEIKAAWKKFDESLAFCVLRHGKWEDTPLINGVRPPIKIDGTAAKTRPLKDVMDFPEFLEQQWAR